MLRLLYLQGRGRCSVACAAAATALVAQCNLLEVTQALLAQRLLRWSMPF